VLRRLGADPDVQAVVLPRTREQREMIRALALPSLILPDHAVDAQSLVALSDVVVSAGGTMNREAAALGVPVFSMFTGRLGAVDQMLVDDGRLELLRTADALQLRKREDENERVERDPALLLDHMLTALE
jgi:hypothetical protein